MQEGQSCTAPSPADFFRAAGEAVIVINWAACAISSNCYIRWNAPAIINALFPLTFTIGERGLHFSAG
jgi:hypothetical protein